MILHYAMLNQIDSKAPRTGKMVVTFDEKGVGNFLRLHKGEALQEGEHLLKYRRRGRVRIGAESYFFQEGHGKYYEAAVYGQLKLAEDGNVLLAGLVDKDFQLMKGPPVKPADLWVLPLRSQKILIKILF